MAFAKFKVKKGIMTADSAMPAGYDPVPVGLILPYSKQTPPSGWLMCDGTSTTGYPDLAALVGSNTPNLNGSVIVGRGTGLGAGLSGSGQITGPSLPSVTINSTPSTTNTNPMVSFSHSHPMSSHSHDITHSHNYPHSHSFEHFHGTSHGHGSPTAAALATHAHSSWFTNTIATGTAGRAANSITGPAAFPTSPGGGSHSHGNYGVTTAPVGSSGNSWGASGSVNTFNATETTTTGSSNATTGSLGSSLSPSGAFSIVQPIIGIYYIIKY